MAKTVLTVWQRLIGLMKLDKQDVLQTFYYAVFAGLVNLSLPLGIQAIINLIQGAQISTSWIVLVVLVTGWGGFWRLVAVDADPHCRKYATEDFYAGIVRVYLPFSKDKDE